MNAWTAEESLLAVLMADNALFWRVADTVCEQDFSPDNRWLFVLVRDTIRDGKAADAVTLGDVIDGERLRQLMDIASNAPGQGRYVESYAKQVQDVGERRRVREAGQRITLAGSYSEAQNLLADVRPQQSARLKTATDGLREMMESLQARFEATSVVTGCPTGFAHLDEITGGFQEGDLVGLGGATSSGKTAVALQCAIAAGHCYYGSLEMMASQLIERAVSQVGHIPYRYLRFPREAPPNFLKREEGECAEYPMTIYEAAALVKTLPLVIDDQPGLTVDQIAARARQLHMRDPLKLIVVDHLNLVRRPRKNDAAELGEIAIALKNLAKDLRVPVLLLVQLNRESAKGDDKRPQLSAFRNSGEIEEALDTAVMVYRDEYYNPNGPLAGYAELIVRKQRQGERNVTAWAKSFLSQMRFESCDPPEQSTGHAENANGRGGFATRYGAREEPRAISGFGRDN